MSDGARGPVLVGALLLAAALFASFLMERRAGSPSDPLAGPAQEGRRVESVDIPFAEQQRRVRIEVLNGGGEAGAAAAVDRSGREGAAARVAERLGGAELRVDLEPELYLDATVVLGRDWRSRLSPPSSP